MENNIVHTIDRGERVTSTYAEIYLNDYHCDYSKAPTPEPTAIKKLGAVSKFKHKLETDEWVSPSDLLIGILDLLPPFTSKITRGKTHEGILDIGNQILNNEHAKFMNNLTKLIHENDSAWSNILCHERESVISKVKEIYGKIFMKKSKIMKQEIDIFYADTLQELEATFKTQLDKVLISAHASIISDLNTEIKQKLQQERDIVEKVLQKRYDSEVKKLKHYYSLLQHNEIYRNQKLVNHAIRERNDALNAFYRQIEAENITSTMYVMSLERKKCRIKQFIMENYQNLEISEKYQKIKERKDIIKAFQERDVHISEINRAWTEKIQNVLQVFLKFISFSLKLLPEQMTFLLDLEKMVVLQLNEIQKSPKEAQSIIVTEENLVKNVFKFEEQKKEEIICRGEPIIVIGDLSDPIPPHYGSRETLPSDVDLPVVRLDRKFVYARCHGYEQIKALLEQSKRGEYRYPNHDMPEDKSLSSTSSSSSSSSSSTLDSSGSTNRFKCNTNAGLPSKKESSDELLLLDDIGRLNECPVRRCKDWSKRLSFPCLDCYLDFSEDNYKRIKAILGKKPAIDPTLELLDPKRIARSELPFSVTKEPYHSVETQYSSQEDLYVPDIDCPCVDNINMFKQPESSHRVVESPSKEFNAILAKRKISINRIIQENPRLLKIFTDESFDFVL